MPPLVKATKRDTTADEIALQSTDVTQPRGGAAHLSR
jgi:hypothetical protein